jgi:peptidoglycan/xylan/chitin deacetylase (PgdA/CDA1 family)
MAASALARCKPAIAGVPILLYHGIVEKTPARDKYCVSCASFRAQLVELHAAGCTPVQVRHVASANPAKHPVAISFDDGLASDYHSAFPLLAEHGLTATFFVNTANVGCAGFLSWQEMREMQRAGMSFQSHGHFHFPVLRLRFNECVEQLRLSRQLLEQHLGDAVDCFSAPYNFLNARVVEAARQAGFKVICSSRNWPARAGQPVLGRIAIYQHTSLAEFRQLISGSLQPFLRRRLRDIALAFPRRIVLRFWPQRLGVVVPEHAACRRIGWGSGEST